MRSLRIILVLCAVLLFGGLAWFVLSHAHVQEKRLADGSILRIEKVAFGKQEHIMPGGKFQQLLQYLPLAVRKYFAKVVPVTAGPGSWNMVSTVHTNEKALYVYITRRDGKTGKYLNVEADTAALVDAHGCVLEETQSGGWNDGSLTSPAGGRGGMQSTVNWFRFEAFPRQEGSFRLRLFNRHNNSSGRLQSMGEFVTANPAPAPPKSSWTPQPLPVTQTIGGVSFSLSEVTVRTNRNEWAQAVHAQTANVKFDVTENGQPSSSWLPLTTELFDSDGNFATDMDGAERFLCPRVAMWKYRVKFFGDEDSRAASNAVWVLRGVEVPGEGKYTLLNATNDLQGVPLLVGAIGGPGVFTYSNSIALKAEPHDENVEADQGWRGNSANVINWPNNWRGGRFGTEKPTYRVSAQCPHLAVDVGELSPDQRFTVRAVDEHGWVYHAYKIGWGGGLRAGPRLKKAKAEDYLDNGHPSEPPFLALQLGSDSKKVDIYICVHTCYTAEFIFKPPQGTNSLTR